MSACIGLLSTLSTPIPLPKPPELETADDLARRFQMKRADLDPPPPEPVGDKSDTGVKDPGQNDKKDQGGGKKMKDTEGKLGFNNSKDKTQLPGEARPTTHLGGLTDVLEGDTGKEIRNTLQSINSVSSVLSGMNSATLVQGGGTGTGLKGGGAGGGGNGPGVAYGGGTLDTGVGAGNGGGMGRGGGGPGGRGNGGSGRGGNPVAERGRATAGRRTGRSEGQCWRRSSRGEGGPLARADPPRRHEPHRRGARLLRDGSAAQPRPQGRGHHSVVDRPDGQRDRRIGRRVDALESARRRLRRAPSPALEVSGERVADHGRGLPVQVRRRRLISAGVLIR